MSYLIFLDLQTSHYTIVQCLVDVNFDCICEFARSTYCMRSSKPLLAWFFGYVVCQIIHCLNWGVICNAGVVYNSASVSCSIRTEADRRRKRKKRTCQAIQIPTRGFPNPSTRRTGQTVEKRGKRKQTNPPCYLNKPLWLDSPLARLCRVFASSPLGKSGDLPPCRSLPFSFLPRIGGARSRLDTGEPSIPSSATWDIVRQGPYLVIRMSRQPWS